MSLAANTVTPRPPLNIFEVERRELQSNTWFQMVEAPHYYIPRNGPNPARSVNTALIMTGLIVSNIHTASIRVSARIKGTDGHYYTVLNASPVPPNDFLTISLDRQVMKSSEILELSVPTNTTSANHATVHFSYIVNQREEFEDDTP